MKKSLIILVLQRFGNNGEKGATEYGRGNFYMEATLSITGEGLSTEDLKELSIGMKRLINDETDLEAEIPKTPGKPGDKGDIPLWGQIVLTAFTSGAVVALISVLKSYVERKRSIVFEINRKDGEKLTLNAQNLSGDQVDQTLKMAQSFIGEEE